jgi:dTDP-4-amino-4,6-dideoxygalactose transaminase
LAYKEFGQMSFPVTETIHDQVLSLPISQVMSEKEVTTVVEVINSFNQ